MFLEKYSDVINLENKNGNTGFVEACKCDSKEVICAIIEKRFDVTKYKNHDEKTGYDYLSKDSKQYIANYIKNNNLEAE